MEKIIYEEAIARITAQSAYITSLELTAPVTQGWYEDQISSLMKDKDNEEIPFDFPAILYQFTPTKYVNQGINKMANGELSVYVVQNKMYDWKDGGESHTAFKTSLLYADTIINLFDKYKLPCSARLMLTNVERDHNNRNIMVDKITFSWSKLRIKPSGVPD